MEDNIKSFDHYYNRVRNSIKITRLDDLRVKIDIEETLESTFSCLGCSGIIFGIIMFILFSNDYIVWFSWFYPYWFGAAIIGILFRTASNNYYIYDKSNDVLQYHVSFFFLKFNWSWVSLSEFDRLSASSGSTENSEDKTYDWKFLLQFPSVPDIELGSFDFIPSEFVNQIGENIAETIGLDYLPGIQGKTAPKRYLHSESTLLELVDLSKISHKIPLLIESGMAKGSIFGKLFGLSLLGTFLSLILDLTGVTPGQMKYTPVFFFASIIFLALDQVHVSYYVLVRSKGVLVYCKRWLKSSSIKIVQHLSDLEKLEVFCFDPLENGKISFYFFLKFRKNFIFLFGPTLEAESFEEINKYGKIIAENLETTYLEVEKPK